MPKAKYTKFKPQIRSRHDSHDVLRKKGTLPLFSTRSVVRFGSTTEYDDTISKGGNRVEINTVQAVKNSADKLLMKERFTEANVSTAPWWTFSDGLFLKNNNSENGMTINDLPFPLVTKHRNGSRGSGNIKHDTPESLSEWLSKKLSLNAISNYIIEQYLPYVREYRLHVTKDGCFYTCRKMIKSDTPEHKRWFRNDSNSVWILETNDIFDKPTNWEDIVSESVKSLKAVGLDIGAVDVRVQSSKTKNGSERKYPKFFIIEINSAPSFGEITAEKYVEQISNILQTTT